MIKIIKKIIKDEPEAFWGGIFAIIAVLATIAVLVFSGFAPENVAGTIKDVFGTLVSIFLLWAIIKNRIPSRDFKKTFENGMKEVTDFYGKLIREETASDKAENELTETERRKKKKLDKIISYEMALYGKGLLNEKCTYSRFCAVELSEINKLELLIRKSFFKTATCPDPDLNAITDKIIAGLIRDFSGFGYEIESVGEDKIVCDFKDKIVNNANGAEKMIAVINKAVLYYVMEMK